MSKRLPIFLGLLLVAFAVWCLITTNPFIHSLLQRLDNLGYDVELRTHVLTHKPQINSPVAIIDIDDKSLAAEGRWPWPRALLAQLVDKLAQQGVVVIAFDILFSEKEENIAQTLLDKLKQKNALNPSIQSVLQTNMAQFDEDSVLAKSMTANTTALAIGFLPDKETENLLPKPLMQLSPQLYKELNIIQAEGYISNIPVLETAAQGGGFINIFPDGDGIIRRAPLIMEYHGNLYPALSLEAVLLFLSENVSLITPTYDRVHKLEGISIGSTTVSTDEQGQVLIPFIGKSFSFPYYSATDVLHDKIPQDALLGKIVFVGTTALGEGDLHSTAIQSPFPGVEIQATLVNGMLQNGGFSYIPAWTFGTNLFITLLIGLISALWFPYLGPRTLGSFIVLFPALMLFINTQIWEHTGLIISLLMPVILVLLVALLNIIYGYLFETRKREALKEMFGQYVPEKHIDEMIKTSSSYALHGEDREMSVLFADIRNFTTISEGMSATDLVDMLNTFFTPMTEIIFKHRGTIDKYVGDLIMAFWGAPLKDKNHARHAIESALEMQSKLKELRPMLAERKWPDIHIGIGINSGVMSVGDMGSRFRRNYTVLGDSVNLASRVEGLSKFYGVDIVVTENTQQDQPRFVFRKLDKVRVKGKLMGVGIYEVICNTSEASPELQQELALFHKAQNYYFEQKWDEAYELMEQLHMSFPDTKIYKLYVERIKEFKEHPLPADWDGVYVHLAK